MKGITATYRMTNKPLPVRHSPYVAGVLRPLKVYNINYVLWFIYIIIKSQDNGMVKTKTKKPKD